MFCGAVTISLSKLIEYRVLWCCWPCCHFVDLCCNTALKKHVPGQRAAIISASAIDFQDIQNCRHDGRLPGRSPLAVQGFQGLQEPCLDSQVGRLPGWGDKGPIHVSCLLRRLHVDIHPISPSFSLSSLTRKHSRQLLNLFQIQCIAKFSFQELGTLWIISPAQRPYLTSHGSMKFPLVGS